MRRDQDIGGGGVIIGIDPGLDGAVGVLWPTGKFYSVIDTPTITIQKSNGKEKREYNLPLMLNIIKDGAGDVAALEVGHPRPGEGTVSAYSIGRSVALWEAFLVSQGIPYTKCYPHVWKKKMMNGMSTKDKGSSVLRAVQLFPEAAESLKRKKDHGRAEALLLAKYLLESRG